MLFNAKLIHDTMRDSDVASRLTRAICTGGKTMAKPGGAGGTGGLKWVGTSGDDVAEPATNSELARTVYDGRGGSDTLDLSALSTGISLSISLATKGSGGSRLWPQESFSGSWWTYSDQHLNGAVRIDNSIKSIESIIGTSQNDFLDLRGGSGARFVDGGAGDDAIQVYGSSGTSMAVGGTGSDQLFGNLSSEVLVGGTWDGASATGDGTTDEFVMWAGTILDFECGTDSLYIDATGNNMTSTVAATLWVNATTSYGAAAQLHITADRVITLVGVTAEEMNSLEKGFLLVSDGELTSLAGDDLILDNQGVDADRLIFPAGSGDDLVIGFDISVDTLVFSSGVETWTQINYHGDTALVLTYDSGQSSVTLVGLTMADTASLAVEVVPAAGV